MAVVTNDGAVVFSLVSIYDVTSLGNLSAQSTSAQLRPILTPHALILLPDRFGPMIRIGQRSSSCFLSSSTNQWCMRV